MSGPLWKICPQCGQTPHPGARCAYLSVPIAYSGATCRAMAAIEAQLRQQQSYWEGGNGSTDPAVMAENSMIYGRMTGLAIAMVAICEQHRQEADRERWYKVQVYLNKSACAYAGLRVPAPPLTAVPAELVEG